MTILPSLFPAVTLTMARDRKIRTALRTNPIVGFITVPSGKKIEDITRWREDMNFMFKWQEQLYLSSERSD